MRDFKQKPGGTSQDRLQFLSPRLGSEVYTQFSHTGCDAAHWTGVYAPFSPLSFFFFLRIKAWIHCTEDNQWITKKKKIKKKIFILLVSLLSGCDGWRPRVSFTGITLAHRCWLQADVGWEVIGANYPSYRVYFFRSEAIFAFLHLFVSPRCC